MRRVAPVGRVFRPGDHRHPRGAPINQIFAAPKLIHEGIMKKIDWLGVALITSTVCAGLRIVIAIIFWIGGGK